MWEKLQLSPMIITFVFKICATWMMTDDDSLIITHTTVQWFQCGMLFLKFLIVLAICCKLTSSCEIFHDVFSVCTDFNLHVAAANDKHTLNSKFWHDFGAICRQLLGLRDLPINDFSI